MKRLLHIKHIIYLKYIRYRINNIKNINHVIDIIKNINYFYPKDGVNSITEILIECLQKNPITEPELQKIALIFEEFKNNFDIRGFSINVLWLSMNQFLIEYLS